MWRRGPVRFLSRAKPQKSHAALHTLVTETSQIAGSRFRSARRVTVWGEGSISGPFDRACGGPRCQRSLKLRGSALAAHASCPHPTHRIKLEFAENAPTT